jgi:predicted nucleic acid-binding protein
MATYFLDTSAIVKRYIVEPGRLLLLAICDPDQGHDLYISQAALVETVATFCRKTHEKSITTDKRDKLINAFRQDTHEGYGIRLVTTGMYTQAGNLCRSHRLRAYDAVQLACALDLRNETRTQQAPVPIFVCADNNLLAIASAEGLQVENPNNYPATEIVESKTDEY